MTTAEATDYFEGYARAFDRFDTEAIVDFMDVPLTVTTAEQCAVFPDREAVFTNFEAGNENHRSLGYHHAELTQCAVVRSLSEALVEVDTGWRFLRADGSEIYSFPMTYILRSAGGWKISVAIQR